jgi:hypothetical protein
VVPRDRGQAIVTATSAVSTEVRELLATRVDSFEKLDMVIALHAAPNATLSVDALVRTMGCTRELVRQTLGELRRTLLVDLTSRGEAQLLLPSEADRRVVRDLVELHQSDRSIVVRLLGELAMNRIRGMAARAFSDAFLIGKKKGDDDG